MTIWKATLSGASPGVVKRYYHKNISCLTFRILELVHILSYLEVLILMWCKCSQKPKDELTKLYCTVIASHLCATCDGPPLPISRFFFAHLMKATSKLNIAGSRSKVKMVEGLSLHRNAVPSVSPWEVVQR